MAITGAGLVWKSVGVSTGNHGFIWGSIYGGGWSLSGVNRQKTIGRFTWYLVIFQTGPRDGVVVPVLQYNNKNALSNFEQ